MELSTPAVAMPVHAGCKHSLQCSEWSGRTKFIRH